MTLEPRIRWVNNEAGLLVPKLEGAEHPIDVAWAPQPGSQVAFLACPIGEALYEGTRGPGKTDTLLMDFLQDVGKGWGAEWKGILFRETYPQLQDVISKANKWFKLIFPDAVYNKAERMWTFRGGEQLLFRHMASEDDYWNYHGHAYPWIGWEELCNWKDDKCFTVMMSCNRSPIPGIPTRIRSTTNPSGPGHNWVKSRYRLPGSRGKVIRDARGKDGSLEPPRVAIHGNIFENRILLHADPGYIARIKAAARNPSELAAWLYGSWTITAGGMFDDIWDERIHIVPDLPPSVIPRGWRIDRSFDWGSSKPFSVGWWAESNGEPFSYNGHTYGGVRGDLYRIAEWYGWNGTRNEGVKMEMKDIARGILDREDDMGIKGRVQVGVADSAIFDEENGVCIARDSANAGVRWEPCDKGPGSRVQGWEMMRSMLKGALPPKGGGPRENPGLFVMGRCQQFVETVPSLPRDDKKLDDVETKAEDHIGDETRYRIRRKSRAVRKSTF